MTDRLIDRQTERAELRGAWRRALRGAPQLIVLWGRRRVGKTYLLGQVMRGLPAVFFGATQQGEGVELGRLAEAVRRDLGAGSADLAAPHFANWEMALRWFAAQARERPLALVLDEVPYLTRSTPGFASIVQVVWDHLARGTKLMLVLTGSAVGTMEGLLGEGAPLRGRPTLARRLDPLDLWAARPFLPRLEPEAYLQAYAACGGYPLHLKTWNPRASLKENLLTLAYSAGGLLMADAAGMLAEELSGQGGYGRILAAVGRGRTRFGEIAQDTGQRVEAPLELLVRAGLLRRALPLGAPKAAKPLYEISDPYLSFWFRCLYGNQAEVDGGQTEALYARLLPEWQKHVGWVFEEAARAHAVRCVAQGTFDRQLLIGRWWASTGEACEVDVLGLSGSRAALLGEARWQAAPLGLRELEALKAKVARTPHPVESPVFAFWSRGGIAPELRRAGAVGFSLGQMLKG